MLVASQVSAPVPPPPPPPPLRWEIVCAWPQCPAQGAAAKNRGPLVVCLKCNSSFHDDCAPAFAKDDMCQQCKHENEFVALQATQSRFARETQLTRICLAAAGRDLRAPSPCQLPRLKSNGCPFTVKLVAATPLVFPASAASGRLRLTAFPFSDIPLAVAEARRTLLCRALQARVRYFSAELVDSFGEWASYDVELEQRLDKWTSLIGTDLLVFEKTLERARLGDYGNLVVRKVVVLYVCVLCLCLTRALVFSIFTRVLLSIGFVSAAARRDTGFSRPKR